jgi:hypothetical protein
LLYFVQSMEVRCLAFAFFCIVVKPARVTMRHFPQDILHPGQSKLPRVRACSQSVKGLKWRSGWPERDGLGALVAAPSMPHRQGGVVGGACPSGEVGRCGHAGGTRVRGGGGRQKSPSFLRFTTRPRPAYPGGMVSAHGRRAASRFEAQGVAAGGPAAQRPLPAPVSAIAQGRRGPGRRRVRIRPPV